MPKNLKGQLAYSLLAQASRARFSELFGVASRKSIFAWQESEWPEAEVVVLDEASTPPPLPSPPPCVIWVGPQQPAALSSAWSGRLAQNYTVSDLIDTLDRAAVFLMDWRARQAARTSPPAVAASTAAPVDPAPDGCYRLTSWVFLGEPFDSAQCLNALALLSRQPVTPRQLQDHSGLGPAMVTDLLQELERRQVLQVSAPAPAVPNPPTASQGGAPLRGGLVQRLTQWLRGAR